MDDPLVFLEESIMNGHWETDELDDLNSDDNKDKNLFIFVAAD